MTDEGKPAETIRLTQEQLDALLEYSLSLPTGTTIGKRWKRNMNVRVLGAKPDWYMGEYVEASPPDPKQVGIVWRRIEVGPQPPPDAESREGKEREALLDAIWEERYCGTTRADASKALSEFLQEHDAKVVRGTMADVADFVELAELDDESGMVYYVHAIGCPGPCDYACNVNGFQYDGMPLHQVLRHIGGIHSALRARAQGKETR